MLCRMRIWLTVWSGIGVFIRQNSFSGPRLLPLLHCLNPIPNTKCSRFWSHSLLSLCSLFSTSVEICLASHWLWSPMSKLVLIWPLVLLKQPAQNSLQSSADLPTLEGFPRKDSSQSSKWLKLFRMGGSGSGPTSLHILHTTWPRIQLIKTIPHRLTTPFTDTSLPLRLSWYNETFDCCSNTLMCTKLAQERHVITSKTVALTRLRSCFLATVICMSEWGERGHESLWEFNTIYGMNVKFSTMHFLDKWDTPNWDAHVTLCDRDQ